MVHTASLLARSVKGGGGGGGVVIFRVRSPNDSNAAPSGVGGWRVGRGGGQMRRTSPTSSEMRQSLGLIPFFIFFLCLWNCVFGLGAA